MNRVLVGLALVALACGGGSGPAPAPAPAVEPVITTAVPDATITSSSVFQDFQAHGVLHAEEPGWHAQSPPVYPEWIRLDFKAPQAISGVSLLPQDNLAERGPRRVRVESSNDGSSWSPVYTIEDACTSEKNRWRTFTFGRQVTTAHLRLMVDSNCGDSRLLTLRGLRLQ